MAAGCWWRTGWSRWGWSALSASGFVWERLERVRQRVRERVTWLTESYISSWWSELWSAGQSPWWWASRCRWWGTSWDWKGSHGWQSWPGRTWVQWSPRPQTQLFQSKSPSRDLECGRPSPEPGRSWQELSRQPSWPDRGRGRISSRTGQRDI